jgi:hypothetical protein
MHEIPEKDHPSAQEERERDHREVDDCKTAIQNEFGADEERKKRNSQHRNDKGLDDADRLIRNTDKDIDTVE